VQREIGGHIQAISLVILHLAEVLLTLLDHNMAGGTRAVPSTGVLQVNSVIQANVEHGTRLAMLRVGHCIGIELDGEVVREYRELGHEFIISERREFIL
jgi:hypothetical protein